jgi:hypothetical protein
VVGSYVLWYCGTAATSMRASVGPLLARDVLCEERRRKQAYKCDGSSELEVRAGRPEADSPVGSRAGTWRLDTPGTASIHPSGTGQVAMPSRRASGR